MGPTLPLGADVWDLDRLRLPAERVGKSRGSETASPASARGPVHQGADPSCLDCVGLSAPRGGSPGCDGLSVSLLSGSDGVNRWGLDAIANGLRISDRSARRGLHAAELAGLLAVEREPGCKLAVSVLDLPEPEAGPERRPLYGPIPWSWWLPASRLPGAVPPSRVGLLALGGLEPIGRFRAGVG